MPRNIAAAIIILVVFLTGSGNPAFAQENPWRLTARQGLVQLSLAGQAPRAAQINEVIGAGAIVTTGADSTATIDNGLQLLVMSANSRLIIPEKTPKATSGVLQDLGSIFFKVDHRKAPHFRVDTPLLAAIVKGTSFTVSVGVDGTTVAVEEGTVDVRAKRSDEAKDVQTGQAVRIEEVAPKKVIGPFPQRDAAKVPAISSPGGTTGAAPLTSTGYPDAQGGSAASPFRESAASNRSGSGAKNEFDYLGYVLAAFLGGVAFFVAARLGKAVFRDATKKRNHPSRDK